MKITDEQARVAKALVSGPKALGEIVNETGLSEDEVKSSIDALMKYGIIRRYKDKYRIIEAVRRGLENQERISPGEYNFRVYAIFEGISESREALEKAQEDLIAKFKADDRFEILDLNVEEILENDGVYTSMFEAEVVAKTFHDLVYMVITYGPSSIELIEPSRFEIKASEGQGILMDVAEVVHSYAQIIADLSKRLSKLGSKSGVVLKVNK